VSLASAAPGRLPAMLARMALRELRALAFTDRNTGKDPLDRISGYPHADPGQPPGPRADDPGQPPAHPGPADDPGTDALRDDGWRDDEQWSPGDDNGNDAGRPVGGGSPPFPASIHLLVPVGTLLG
jgi:hypothetical protein